MGPTQVIRRISGAGTAHSLARHVPAARLARPCGHLRRARYQHTLRAADKEGPGSAAEAGTSSSQPEPANTPSTSGRGSSGTGSSSSSSSSSSDSSNPMLRSADAISSFTSTTPDAPSIPYKLIAGLASAGAAETTYLMLSKLLHTDVACPTNGCASVLSSPYATLFGLPLPLYGMLTYATVAAIAVIADNVTTEGGAVPKEMNTALLAGCGVLATVSAALMYLLQTALAGLPCVWCYTSAGLSFALLTSLLVSLDGRHLSKAAVPGLGATAAAALVVYAGWGPIASSGAQDIELEYAAPAVTADSSKEAVSMAARLKAAGAKMYGAFWCTHCFDQKQSFGKQAMADFPYVECYPEGWKRGIQIAGACDAAGVKAFPTWVIGGKITEGELDLPALTAQLDALEASGQQQQSAPGKLAAEDTETSASGAAVEAAEKVVNAKSAPATIAAAEEAALVQAP